MEVALSQYDEYSYYNVSAFLSYYEDQNDSETIGSIVTKTQWTKNTTGKVLNFGFVKYPVWIRFPANVQHDDAQQWHLVIPYPLLQHAEVYLISDNSGDILWNSDLQKAFHDPRSLRSHHINFALPDINKENLSFYLKVKSNTSLQVPLEIWARDYLIMQQNVETLLWGLYFGIIFALVFYNSFLFVSMRDQTYAYYVFTLVSVMMLMLSLSGFGFRYVWDSPRVTEYMLPITPQ